MDVVSAIALVLVAAAIAALATPLVIRFARRIGAVDKPNDRKVSLRNEMPLMGGLAVGIGWGTALIAAEVFNLVPPDVMPKVWIFAGGAFLSFAHDFRFMRSDRGWLCMPEVDINIPLGPVFLALSRRAVPTYKFEEMQFTGIRLTAQECVEHHIVRKAAHIDDLMKEVLAFAKTLNKDRKMIQKMKLETHKEILTVIDESISSLSQ